jgi:hypothetical protein
MRRRLVVGATALAGALSGSAAALGVVVVERMIRGVEVSPEVLSVAEWLLLAILAALGGLVGKRAGDYFTIAEKVRELLESAIPALESMNELLASDHLEPDARARVVEVRDGLRREYARLATLERRLARPLRFKS